MNWLNVILLVIKAELLVVTKMQYTSAFIRNVFDKMFSASTIVPLRLLVFVQCTYKARTDRSAFFCLHFVFFCF